jgi:hypothetical protein
MLISSSARTASLCGTGERHVHTILSTAIVVMTPTVKPNDHMSIFCSSSIMCSSPSFHNLIHIGSFRASSFQTASLPNLTSPLRSMTAVPNPSSIHRLRTHPVQSSTAIPNRALLDLTDPVLDCQTATYLSASRLNKPIRDCQTISHPTKPHLFYPLNSSTA